MADAKYLQETVGPALTAGLASVASVQPEDPVDYLAHWLLKYLAVEEQKALAVKAKEHAEKERERVDAEEQAKIHEQGDNTSRLNSCKESLSKETSIDKLYNSLIETLRKETEAKNVYVAFLEQREAPEGAAPEPEEEAVAPPEGWSVEEGRWTNVPEGEEPPPPWVPPKIMPRVPTYCALTYKYANRENSWLRGKEILSPALSNGTATVSFQAVQERKSVLVSNVLESDPPLVFHGMPLPGSFAVCPLLASEDDKYLEGRVLGLIFIDTLSSSSYLSDKDLEVLQDLRSTVSFTHEKLILEAKKRVEEEQAAASRLLNEDCVVPEEKKPVEEDGIDELEGKLTFAQDLVQKVKDIIGERMPMERKDEHGHELSEISTFEAGTVAHRVVASVECLVKVAQGDGYLKDLSDALSK
mmetsp:Transcript_42788/g.134845  ORF Transcript_42788/g.134845 Transcript_42788/m.134845 type:complete len:414 (-) Transcript_42788:390-1631(-)